MMDAIITYLKTKAGAHLEALVIAGVLILLGHSWLAEHDARLAAAATVQVEQTQIDGLKAQQSAVTKAATVQLVQLQAAAAKVTSAPEAIAAIAAVTPAATPTNPAPELDAVPVPDAPTKTEVNAVPLYEDLNACKQTEIKLDACVQTLNLQTRIDADKDTEIVALKKKPGFWKRVLSTAKAVGVGVGIGVVLSSKL